MTATADRDAGLMARVAIGDEAALREIALLHGGRIVRLAQRLLGSAAEADEITQETLLRVWRNAASFDRGKGEFTAWMGSIAWRLCADRLRMPGRGLRLDLEAAAEVESGELDPEAELIRRQRIEQLEMALDRLPARQRAAFVLFHVEELGGVAAGETLGVSTKAFWSLLDRARAALTRDLGPAWGQEERS